jgi:hypothetical protein
MAGVLGTRSTGTVLQASRKVDMAERIMKLEPSSYPLTVLTNALNKDSAHNPEYSWIEKALEPRFAAVAGAQTNVDTAIEVAAGQGVRFAAHFLVKNTRTGEVFRVVSVATDTLTVVRGVGGGNVAMNDTDELLVIGVAKPEGDDISPARSNNGTKVTNYTQIFRTPFGATETSRHSDTFTSPSDWDDTMQDAGIEHAKDIEYNLWFGKPSEDLSSPANPRRTTGGVEFFANQNITDAGGALTETELFTAFRAPLRYSSDQRVAFGSMLSIDVINTFPRGKLQVQQADSPKTYGLAVFRYVSPHGTIRFITHKLFEGGVYGGKIAILDMSQIKYRYLSNSQGSRDTHLETNRQGPGVDGRIDEYLTEAGLQCGLALTHGWITNITGAG